MIRGRLILETPAGDLECVLERLSSHGAATVELVEIELRAAGDSFVHHLRPVLVDGLARSAIDPKDTAERAGPFLRVYATHPREEA